LVAPFSQCNIVYVSNNNSDAIEIDFASLLENSQQTFSFAEKSLWGSGNIKTYSTVNSQVTFSTLPIPYGRGSTYHLQEKVLRLADVFLVLLHTSYFDEQWINRLSSDFSSIPSIFLISEDGNEEAIRNFKSSEKSRLFYLLKNQRFETVSSKILFDETVQEHKNEIKQMKGYKKKQKAKQFSPTVYRIPEYTLTPYHYPVISAEVVRSKIHSVMSTTTQIYEIKDSVFPVLEPPSPPDQLEASEDLIKVRRLFSRILDQSLELQREKGINEEVQRRKKEPLEEEEAAEQPEAAAGKKNHKTKSWFSGLTKIFGSKKSLAVS